MARKEINVGTSPNKGDGDPLRTAFRKINENFAELYTGNFAEPDVMTSTLAPDTDGIYDLGKSNKRWADLYVKDFIYLNGSRIELTPNGTLLINGGPPAERQDTVGSVFADDSTVMVDGIAGKVVGPVDTTTVDATIVTATNLNGLLTGNVVGNVTGDVKGSVFADDSTVIINGTENSINLDGTVKGNIIPDADEAYDIGSMTHKFRDLYLSGSTINLGGVEITNDGGVITFGGEKVVVEGGTGDVKGSVFGDDSTLLVDSIESKIVGPVETTTVIANTVAGNLTGNVTGDLTGSVFGDDSTLLVDGVNGKINLQNTVLNNTISTTDEVLYLNTASTPGERGFKVSTTDSIFDIYGATLEDGNGGGLWLSGGIAEPGMQGGDVIISGRIVSILAGDNDGSGGIALSGPIIGRMVGDIQGSVFADDSTTLVDGVNGKIVGDIQNNLIETNNITALPGDTDLYIQGGIDSGTPGNPARVNIGTTNTSTIILGASDSLIYVNGNDDSIIGGGTGIFGTITGDLTGSVFSDDSTLLVDGMNGKITGDVETTSVTAIGIKASVIDNNGGPLQIKAGLTTDTGNTIFINPYGSNTFIQSQAETYTWLTGPYLDAGPNPSLEFKTAGAFKALDGAFFEGNLTGNVTGDVVGSVFADDSTLLVDGLNGVIPTSVLQGDITNPIRTGNVVIESTQSPGSVTITHAGIGGITLDASTSDEGISLEGNVSVEGSFTPPMLTQVEIDALTPTLGMMVYNTTTGKFQGYAADANNDSTTGWADLH